MHRRYLRRQWNGQQKQRGELHLCLSRFFGLARVLPHLLFALRQVLAHLAHAKVLFAELALLQSGDIGHSLLTIVTHSSGEIK